MREPLISVIVPVYKVEAYLDRCVASLVAQTLEDIEIILVDDGSPDRCGEMCDEWAERDERIVVIHKLNGGLSDARNAGIAAARALYVGFVDSDDYADPTMYEVLLRNLLETDADISMCGVADVYANRIETLPQMPRCVMSSEEALSDIFLNKTLLVCVPPRLYPKCLMEAVPAPVGKAHEDSFMLVDLFMNVKKSVVDTTPLYYYCHNEGTITSSSYNARTMHLVEAWERNLALIRAYFPALEQECLFRCYWAHFDVLDDMVLADRSSVNQDDKRRVIAYLKQNKGAIFSHPAVSAIRKIALCALLVSEEAYRRLVVANRKRQHLNG